MVEAFAARLRRLRRDRNLTQVQLAAAAGLERNHLARLERGERHPTWETVLRLAAALGCTPNDFLPEE
jgi:transcriptional regulator with XRE-family HTH domain